MRPLRTSTPTSIPAPSRRRRCGTSRVPDTLMTDLMKFAFPLPPRLLTIPGVVPLELEVVEAVDLGPRMRRILLRGHGLEDFSYQPGQDVMLVLGGGERPLSRRYSIRSFDPQSKVLELNIVAHGVHGPGAEWASATQPGERITAVGPPGNIYLNPAPPVHPLFVDDTPRPA